MKRARIYKPTKTAMQSGKRNTKNWCLEFIPRDTRFVEPIMGWTGSADMYANEVKLFFTSKDEAINYAQRNGVEFELHEPNQQPIKIKSYSDNFKYKKET